MRIDWNKPFAFDELTPEEIQTIMASAAKTSSGRGIIKKALKDQLFALKYPLVNPPPQEFLDQVRNERLPVGVSVILNKMPEDLGEGRNLLAWRSWSLKGSTLFSPYRDTTWKESVLIADYQPNESNVYGVYAYILRRLTERIVPRAGIIGIVQLLGKVVEHDDGRLRAEIGQMLALLLPADTPIEARYALSTFYRMPVVYYESQELMNRDIYNFLVRRNIL